MTTSRLLLQKWFTWHSTPTRMQSDNAPNLTAEVSNEFLKASQVTKVASIAGHPRTQGLAERQNCTLLTLLRVYCSRRMRDWDQHLDEVMGAYNSRACHHWSFALYAHMRFRKGDSSCLFNPEFATQSFESHEAYVDHVLARQQENRHLGAVTRTKPALPEVEIRSQYPRTSLSDRRLGGEKTNPIPLKVHVL